MADNGRMRNVLLGAALAVMVALSGLAFAQAGDVAEKRVTFEARSTDIRDALKMLFKPMEASYTVSPEVQGTVTASFKNIPFETALQAMLLQVDASFSLEAGVYVIEPKAATPPIFPGKPNTPIVEPKVTRKIYIRNADPALILRMLAGSQEMLSPWLNRNSGIGASYSWGGFGGGMGGGSLGLSFGGGF